MADLKQLFKTAVASSMDLRGKPAILGKIDGTLYWSSMRRDMIWARVGENNSNQEMVVHCTKVTPQVDLPVRVDMVNGIMSVVAVDEKRYLEFSGNRPGGNVGAHAWLHGRLGPDPLYVAGLQYLPLLVVPSSPPGLTVTVKQGAYRWDGAYKIFEEAASGSLSAYVPGSSSIKHFVIICLDRVNNTIVIVDGDDLTGGDDALFGGIVLTPGDVTAVSIDDAYLPLAAIVLYNGQTEVRAADIMMDLRTWGGEDFVGAASGIPEPPDDAETYGRKTDGASSWVAVVPKDGGEYTGAVTISLAGTEYLMLDSPADTTSTPSVQFKRNGNLRWQIRQGSFTSNSLTIRRYNNSGTFQDTPIYLDDSTGYVGIQGVPSTSHVINGGVVFNEPGADVDHRFEGDTDANLLFLDAGNDRLGIGTGSPSTKFHVVGSSTLDGATVINESGADVDSRVEGDTDANLTYWDAGNNRVGIGTASPAAKFHVADVDSVAFRLEDSNEGGHFDFSFGEFTTNGTAFMDITPSAGTKDALIRYFRSTNVTGTVRMDILRGNNTNTTDHSFYGGGGYVCGSPTGGNKGVGTINAQAVYDDNVLLSDHILDLYYDGRMSKADKKKHPDARLWSIDETAVFAKENRHLPTMPGRDVWLSAGPRSVGELVTHLWETVEQQQLQIFELNNRLKAVTNG